MKEASKTRNVRPPAFYETFMGGRVLDIGCGDDLCVPNAVPFDQRHGDANHILDYFEPETFDCVHSSHCLEHMGDPMQCLSDWWTLVKPGGFLITVVPDEDLYEQGYWPSIFNSDHKSTFRMDGASSWSPVSYCLPEIVTALPGARILSAQRQTAGYDNARAFRAERAGCGPGKCQAAGLRGLTLKVCNLGRELILNAGMVDTFLDNCFVRMVLATGTPVDQTLGRALAQIEVIARKQGMGAASSPAACLHQE